MISGVFVTQGDSLVLSNLISRIQKLSLDRAVVVVNSDANKSIEDLGIIRIVRTGSNLGGAGGFSLGIQEALLQNPDWIWTCDDDAIPEKYDLVAKLKEKANKLGMDLLSPIIVSPDNAYRLSFPFRFGFKRIWDRKLIENLDFIWGQAHLFNGTLLRAAMVKEVGVPDARFFIRGDEQEYLLRILKQGYKVATSSTEAIIHPSGEDELYPVLFGSLRVPVPSSQIKFSYQIRNRGYITRKFHRFDWLALDLIRHTAFFIFRKQPALKAFSETVILYSSGFIGRIDKIDLISEESWRQINKLVAPRI